MILLLHITIALTSLVCTTYLLFRPSKAGLYLSYGLTAGTLITGTYIVLSTSAHLLSACTTGLLYLGITTFGIVTARKKIFG